MMSERNVGALANLYRLMSAQPEYAFGTRTPTAEEVGEWFAKQGVLVPSALDSAEVVQLSYVCDGGYYTDVEATTAVRAELERIAKGGA